MIDFLECEENNQKTKAFGTLEEHIKEHLDEGKEEVQFHVNFLSINWCSYSW